MTAILWNACEQARDKPKEFQNIFLGADTFRQWKGPSFPDHRGDSLPPSPDYQRDSLADAELVYANAEIYEDALRNVANCYLGAWNRNDYIQWENDWDIDSLDESDRMRERERRLTWMNNQRVEFTTSVYGPGYVVNTYSHRHRAHDDMSHWSFHRYRANHPAPRAVEGD